MDATEALLGTQAYLLGIPLWILTVLPILAASWWWEMRRRSAIGEPPLVPYTIPWLGHGLSFMKDINGFTESVR